MRNLRQDVLMTFDLSFVAETFRYPPKILCAVLIFYHTMCSSSYIIKNENKVGTNLFSADSYLIQWPNHIASGWPIPCCQVT